MRTSVCARCKLQKQFLFFTCKFIENLPKLSRIYQTFQNESYLTKIMNERIYFMYSWLSSKPLSYAVDFSNEFQSNTRLPHNNISNSSGENHFNSGLFMTILRKPRLNALKESSIPLFNMKSAYKSTNSLNFYLKMYSFYVLSLERNNLTCLVLFVTDILSPFSFRLKLTNVPKLSVMLIWKVNINVSSNSSSLPLNSSIDVKLWYNCYETRKNIKYNPYCLST